MKQDNSLFEELGEIFGHTSLEENLLEQAINLLKEIKDDINIEFEYAVLAEERINKVISKIDKFLTLVDEEREFNYGDIDYGNV